MKYLKMFESIEYFDLDTIRSIIKEKYTIIRVFSNSNQAIDFCKGMSDLEKEGKSVIVILYTDRKEYEYIFICDGDHDGWEQTHDKVINLLPFESDYQSINWASFDIQDIDSWINDNKFHVIKIDSMYETSRSISSKNNW